MDRGDTVIGFVDIKHDTVINAAGDRRSVSQRGSRGIIPVY